MPSVQTSRLGVLDAQHLQAVLDRFGLGALVAAEPATTGNFGQNAFVTSDRGSFVLRGNPLVDGQFAREQHAARVLSTETGVRVPWPYYYEPDPGLLGYPYAVLPHLSGIQLADQDLLDGLSTTSWHGLAEAMGRVAADLHTATRPVAGRLVPPATDPSAESDVVAYGPDYADWLAATVAETAGRATGVTSEDRDWLAGVVDAGLAALRRFQPVVLHGDLSVYNAVGSLVGDRWSITGVYDLMSVHVGHPEADLARMFCLLVERDPDLATTFLTAWAGAADEPGVDPLRFRALVVWERIGIWEWAKRTGAGWWDPALGLRDWLSGYFAHIPR